jgi:hypothetical protein
MSSPQSPQDSHHQKKSRTVFPWPDSSHLGFPTSSSDRNAIFPSVRCCPHTTSSRSGNIPRPAAEACYRSPSVFATCLNTLSLHHLRPLSPPIPDLSIRCCLQCGTNPVSATPSKRNKVHRRRPLIADRPSIPAERATGHRITSKRLTPAYLDSRQSIPRASSIP